MNAQLKLTDKERSDAQKREFEEQRKKWDFFIETVTEADNFLGTMLHKAYIERNWIRYGEVMDQLDWAYFKRCGLDELAEHEEERLKAIDRGD